MSLASRIANILIPPQSPHLAPSDGLTAASLTDGSDASGSAAYEAHRDQYSTKTRAMETEEEEGRPPYLHVGSPLIY